MKKRLKIAFLGAGSIGFTRRLVHDILNTELQDIHVSLHDINAHNLDMICQILQRDVAASGLPTVVTADLDRRAALTGADYVICCVRVGGLEAFALDVEIPLKYGVEQCVGDTLCVGGLMYAQRTIPCLLDFCKDIREVANPGAILLNYSNPNAMNTWACNQFGGVRTIGLCHGVQHGGELIARALKVPLEEVSYICAGINHQTWYTRIKHKERLISADELLAGMLADEKIARQEKVRIDMLRRFGYFTTESNGHVSEYVPWYRKRPGEIGQWISKDTWIHGETGGYLRICNEERNWFEHDFPRIMQDKPWTPDGKRSSEHGSYIIESLETGKTYRGCFNVPNAGYITNLPDGCIVEVPAYVDFNGINVPVVGDLPLACAATCSASVRVQEMGMLAAVKGDPMLLKQAMLHDPLTAAVLNPPEIWQLADEMIVAQQQWLPQYRDYIATAEQALAPERYIQSGAAAANPENRVKMRDLEEIAAIKNK